MDEAPVFLDGHPWKPQVRRGVGPRVPCKGNRESVTSTRSAPGLSNVVLLVPYPLLESRPPVVAGEVLVSTEGSSGSFRTSRGPRGVSVRDRPLPHLEERNLTGTLVVPMPRPPSRGGWEGSRVGQEG